MAQVTDIGEYKRDKLPRYSQKRFDVPEQEPRQRIGFAAKWLLLGFSITIDVIVLVLSFFGVGEAASVVATPALSVVYGIWFQMLGVSMIENPRALTRMGLSALGEWVPVVGALPLWTIGTWLTIKIVRSEDKGGIIGKAAGAIDFKNSVKKVA